jgi:adenylate kinase
MFNLVLFGPPGSGKGTQSEKLVAKYSLKHISTGDLLRSEIAAKTPLGLEAKNFMDKGLLVPDEVVIGMIGSIIETHKNVAGFLFDGFPRTKTQAEALDKLLQLHKTEIHLVLSLEVSRDELIKRLKNRGVTSGRSDDADEKIIQERIEEYLRKTAPVAEYYKQLSKLKSIKGEGSVEEIFNALSQAIDEKKQEISFNE